MKEHFAEQLEHLRRRLIVFGAEVEKQIAAAVDAFTEASASKATVVIANDEAINRTEVEIEEEAIHLFALQQPVAVDLRLLIACLKINNDLERIGDHAVNIAECAERISSKKPLKPFIDIPSMGEVAMGMLKDAIDSFVNRDVELARAVILKDDVLDDKNKSIIRELLTYMAESPSLISYSLECISVSKNLERVGDLATNIAEDTIYLAQAKLVKHHAAEMP
ncbi:MAG TPA: phosphate signaling complex protein PhoU [Thermoanaerobaculia bacterium]|jgi:phosphate transport system protein|nr:phosphate signaling complex protein PhoU [Thermoanaerobaculia bacterium]